MRRPSSLLGVVALLGTMSGCALWDRTDSDDGSTSDSNGSGAVRFGVVAAPSIDIDELSYSIQVPDEEPIEGTIPLTEENLEKGIVVEDIPASPDVKVGLKARNDEGVTCEGAGTVAVEAGETAELSIILQCKLPDGTLVTTGTVDVKATFNICPQVTKASAGAATEGSFPVTAEARDLDEGTLKYTWSAESGSFEDESAASTTYTCEAAGEQTLTLTVDDGQGCTHSADVKVTCAGTGPTDAGTPDTGPPPDSGTPPVDSGTPPADSGTPPVDSGTPPADSGAPEPEGTEIPCDVAAIIASRCQGCHGATPISGTPSLITLDGLKADSATYPGTPVYERAHVRVSDNTMPQGLDGGLPAEEKEILLPWLEAGAPGSSESCNVVQ